MPQISWNNKLRLINARFLSLCSAYLIRVGYVVYMIEVSKLDRWLHGFSVGGQFFDTILDTGSSDLVCLIQLEANEAVQSLMLSFSGLHRLNVRMRTARDCPSTVLPLL